MRPYAVEYGRDNGDGTYSVVIERYPLLQWQKPHPDWPAKLLYEDGRDAGRDYAYEECAEYVELTLGALGQAIAHQFRSRKSGG
jgi:hypothetical protein